LSYKQQLFYRVRVAFISIVGMGAIYFLTSFSEHDCQWLLPSMGAAWVLVVFQPSSSIKRFLLLNILAAIIGGVSAILLPSPVAVIVALVCIVLIMQWGKWAHPPAGATAVLTGSVGETFDFRFLAFPLLPNLLVMCLMIWAVRWATREKSSELD